MKTRLLFLASAVVALALHPVAPHARSARSACLDRQLAGAMAQGWHERGVDTESLIPGDSTNYELSFYKGMRYLFLACTDDTDAALTLTVVDQEGKVLGAPSEKGINTLLEVKAARAGAHQLQVQVQSPVEGKPTWYSIATLYR